MSDRFFDHFQGVKDAGEQQWVAKCPAHDDTRASLSIGRTADRWLVWCHAGCSFEDVRAAAGIDWTELFDGEAEPVSLEDRVLRPERVRIPSAKGQPVTQRQPTMPPRSTLEVWQRSVDLIAGKLHDQKGWSLGTLKDLGVGFDGERLVFPHFDNGRWVSFVRYRSGATPKTLSVGPRELWPPPESFAGSLWLVEGEPDAVSMTELGFDAVAVPGVNGWKDGWAERFKGRSVTVLFDCDEQGRSAARARVRDLSDAGVSAKAVELDPSKDGGFDVTDALRIAAKQDRTDDLRAYLLRVQREAWEGGRDAA